MEKKQIIILGCLLTALAGIWMVQFGLIAMPFGASGNQGTIGATQADTASTGQAAAQAGFLTWQRPDPVPAKIKDPLNLERVKKARRLTVKASKGRRTLPASQTRAADGSIVNIHTQRQGAAGAPVQLDDSTPVFFVKGIVYSEKNRSSILIDQSILHEGERVHGATIRAITRRTVTFEKNGKTYVVRVGAKTDA